MPGGRDIFFEAIAAGTLLDSPPGYQEFNSFIAKIINFEKHPKIWAIGFRLLGYLFNWDRQKASDYFDKVINEIPNIFDSDIAIVYISRILRFIPYKKTVQDWIEKLGKKDNDFRKQAQGELLFLYNLIHSNDAWGRGQLEFILENKGNNCVAQRGIAFGASNNLKFIENQELCTKCIIALSKTSDPITQKAVSSIFPYGQKISLNKNMKNIINAILPNDGILIHSAENLVKGISNQINLEPKLIGEICHRIIEVGRDEIRNYGSRYSMVAEPLVKICLTLHRMQPPYRSIGLDLFEELIDSEIPQARTELNILDRKPLLN